MRIDAHERFALFCPGRGRFTLILVDWWRSNIRITDIVGPQHLARCSCRARPPGNYDMVISPPTNTVRHRQIHQSATTHARNAVTRLSFIFFIYLPCLWDVSTNASAGIINGVLRELKVSFTFVFVSRHKVTNAMKTVAVFFAIS